MGADPTASTGLAVIGLSAGGLEPLRVVISNLEQTLPAAVLVAIHASADSPGLLDEILRRDTEMPVHYAKDGDVLMASRIYLAPANHHLTVEGGTLRVQGGPRYNGYRPSIDRLFMSAVASGRSPLVAVLLSGARSDGTAGAKAVRDAGGLVIGQDPTTAALPSMIEHALRLGVVNEVLTPDKIADRVAAHLHEPAPTSPSHANLLVSREFIPSEFTCPDCGGVLQEEKGADLRFECLVGHGWSADGLEHVGPQRTENALWTALEILEEQIALDARLLKRAESAGDRAPLVVRITDRMTARRAAADDIRSALGQLERSSPV